MFSGGSYDEVARWLLMFFNSHAKREHPRIEAQVDAGDERDGKSYGARLIIGEHATDVMEFDYHDVAGNRGTLSWCAALAIRTREQAKALLARSASAHARAR